MAVPLSLPLPPVRAEALVKHYRLGAVDVPVLNGVDFAVQRGEFVAIMGPSGSGKSTLLHLLGGLDRPTSGEVRVAGARLSTLSDDALTLVRRRRIGFVFQAFNLLPTLTAEENILLPVLADGRGAAPYQQKLEALLALVALTDRGHRPDQLSGGQPQRVAIARALIAAPEIILADEPTGNLDSKAGARVLETLRQVCDDLRATLVMVTHVPRAASFADRVVFLKDGAIVDELRVVRDGHAVAQVAERLAALEDA